MVELDELYWFLKQKSHKKTQENVYIIAMVSRKPRQIIGYCASADKSSRTIQKIADASPEAQTYRADGYSGYWDVIFSGKHIYNIHNKKDTFTVESVNADFRRYIPTLTRRSRCFPRRLETLRAVAKLLVTAYSAFGMAKIKFRQNRNSLSRELLFSVLDLL